jgi:hypothetical protein
MSRTTKLNRSQFAASAEHVRAVQERRRSAAAGKHDPRPRKLRSRRAERLDSIRRES